MQSKTTDFHTIDPALPSPSVSDYLRQQHEKKRLSQLDDMVAHLQQRQDRQAKWIIALVFVAMALSSAVLALLIY